MRDKRKSERHPCFIRGEIVFAGDRRRACEVHDISDSGARLVTNHAEAIPDRFILEVPRRRIDSRVEVVRRSDKELGVKFLE